MSTTERSVEVEAESVDEAIEQALGTLEVGRDQARVEVLQDARRTVLGFGGQKARVRVSVSADDTADVTSDAAKDGVDGGAILRRLLALMDIPAEIEEAAADEPGHTWLRIASSAGGLLIGRYGQTLDALEYLVNRLALQDGGTERFLVDAEGYRHRHELELREAAARMAERARRSARPQAMEPLGARDRRIVHLALSEDKSVTTRSTGEGALRRVVVHPVPSTDR